MSDITGNWDASVATPMGVQSFALAVAADGSSLSGTATRDGQTIPLADGRIEGGTASFSVALTQPMAITLAFTVTADGDALSGKAKAGFLPAFDVTGTRRG